MLRAWMKGIDVTAPNTDRVFSLHSWASQIWRMFSAAGMEIYRIHCMGSYIFLRAIMIYHAMIVRWSSHAGSVQDETRWLRWMHRGTWGVKTLCKHASRPHGQPCFDEFGNYGEYLSKCLNLPFCSFGQPCFFHSFYQCFWLGRLGFWKMQRCSLTSWGAPEMNGSEWIEHNSQLLFQVRRPGDGSFLTLQDFDAKAHKAVARWMSELQDTSVGEKIESLELCCEGFP